jgi:hypothetical protein
MLLSKIYLFFLLLTIVFFSCNTPKQKNQPINFTVELKSLKADTVIVSAVYFNDHILCLQEDYKAFVLDTLFKKDEILTTKFKNLNIHFLVSLADTIFIETDKGLYFLDNDFTLKNHSQQFFKYPFPYYDDETYYVYGCSAGEFGGAVFFWDKKTNKTYSYRSTCVQQVFKFKNTYVVSNFLAHLSGFSDYLFIKDPTKLYELKEKQKTFCNWYMDIDSLKDRKLSDNPTPPGVVYYADTFITKTLTTFPYQNEIYSIYSTNKATILAKFQDSKLITVDTLLKNPLTFHDTQTHLNTDQVVSAYRATWAVGGEGNLWTPYQNSGLVFIRNYKITFLEFQTPHMWKGYDR